MNPTSSIALSGVLAASTRMDAAAHNIANAQTKDFHPEVVWQQSQESGGVVASAGRSNEVGADLDADLIEQQQASYQYKANLKTIEVQLQMLGSVLDIKA